MYYNKYKLYSPKEVGGGKYSHDEGSDSDFDTSMDTDLDSGVGFYDNSQNGSGINPPVTGWEWNGEEWKIAAIVIDKTTWEPSIDESWEWNTDKEEWDWEGEGEEPPKKPKKPKRPPKPPRPPKQLSKKEAEIRKMYLSSIGDKGISIYDNKNFEYIKPDGETRTITIKGTEKSKFSLTIKDSSDCDMLRNKIEWVEIPKGGKYTFKQDYPSILVDGSAIKTREAYTIKLTPAADVSSSFGDIVLTQTADPVMTITKTTSQTGPALSVSGDDITITGRANSTAEYNALKTYALTVTGSDTGTAESLYVKDTKFDKNITSSNLIKKVIDRCGETGFVNEISLKPLTTRTTSTIEGGDTISGDLEAGMILYAKVEHTKVVKTNIDEDGNVLDYNKCKTHTDKFQLDNTNDLTLGMDIISDDVEAGTYISSIDCDKKITLLPKQIIKTDATLIFKQEWWATILEVVSNIDSKGNAYVKLSRGLDIPDNTEIEFKSRGNTIQGINRIYNSGSDSISLTSYIYSVVFGGNNVTHTLDLDKIITSKPNAYNQDIVVGKSSGSRSSSNVINMIKYDRDLNASSKTGSVVGSPKNGSISSYATSTDSFTYTPNNEFTGEDSFTFTMSDGVNTSDEKTVRITVK